MPQGDIGTVPSDGRWHNVVEGTDQVSEPFDTREEAVEEGRAMARDLGVEHVVKDLDGSIGERTSFDDEAASRPDPEVDATR